MTNNKHKLGNFSDDDLGLLLWKLESLEKFFPVYQSMMKTILKMMFLRQLRVEFDGRLAAMSASIIEAEQSREEAESA